jgi:hypothetical protein
MSICLPNIRSTSVFKVYYGGTGVTSLTQGGVVIGNGADAVNCITGSTDGQALVWDNTLKTWKAGQVVGTGGTGGTTVLMPDATPTKVNKKRISNTVYGTKCELIDWDNDSNGSFRISEYDPDKKVVTIYNDSNKDLFVSVADDNNPKIIVDFEDYADVSKLNIEYFYISSSQQVKLFDYKLNDIKNIHSYHTHSISPTIKEGYGKNYRIKQCGKKGQVIIYLTPDYLPQNLNKFNEEVTGSYHISLSSSSGKTDPVIFNISSSYDYSDKPYNIYTLASSSLFFSSSLDFATDAYTNRNGFDLSAAKTDKKNIPPEDYSYIVYSGDSLTVDGSEAVLTMFGYYLSPNSKNEEVTLRVTEAR